MSLNSYKYGSNPLDNVSNYLTTVNKNQVALNQAYRGGATQTMDVPSFNVINPATMYEGTIMSQRVNSMLLNAQRNNMLFPKIMAKGGTMLFPKSMAKGGKKSRGKKSRTKKSRGAKSRTKKSRTKKSRGKKSRTKKSRKY